MDPVVSHEFKQLITPLSSEEKTMLRLSLLNEGCREPLIVWKKSDKERILIDGHNRYAICKEFNIPFNIKELKFRNKDEVKDWMIDNQLGRRNLSPDQMSYFRGLKYERLKQNKGGYERVLSKGLSGPLTAEILATEFNISEKTIKRDSQYARGIELIGRLNPEIKLFILTGEAKVKKSDMQLIGSVNTFPKRKLKNLADLHNEIQILKKEVNLQANDTIHKLNAKNKEILPEPDQLFASIEEKLNRKKAQLVSAINICIKNKNKESINDLKKIVDEFETIIRKAYLK